MSQEGEIFLAKVRQMREAQNDYYKTNSATSKHKARQKEKEVDAMLKMYYERQQRRLFK